MPFYKDSLTAAASATGEWGDDDLGPSTSRRRFSYSKEEEGDGGDEGTTTGAGDCVQKLTICKFSTISFPFAHSPAGCRVCKGERGREARG